MPLAALFLGPDGDERCEPGSAPQDCRKDEADGSERFRGTYRAHREGRYGAWPHDLTGEVGKDCAAFSAPPDAEDEREGDLRDPRGIADAAARPGR